MTATMGPLARRLVLGGAIAVVAAALSYFAWVGPHLEEYQSVLGQVALAFAGGRDAGLQALQAERVACVLLGIGGTVAVAAGLAMPRVSAGD